MKVFKFKFSVLVYVLCVLALIIAILSAYFNVRALFYPFSNDFYIVSKVVFALLSLLLFAFIVSVVFFSRYKFIKNKLYCYIGFIKIKIDLKAVVLVREYKLSNKLTLIFNDAKYTVIVIDKKYYSAFVKEIRNVNINAIYDVYNEEE